MKGPTIHLTTMTDELRRRWPALARLRVTSRTLVQYGQMLRRYERFQRLTGYAPAEAVPRWLQTLSLSMGHTAWLALKAAQPELDWCSIPHPRPRRNEPVLRATVLTADERSRIRSVALDRREAAMLECFWVVRRHEVCALHWADLNLTDGSLTLVRKGGKPSWTLLPEPAQAALAAWFEAAGQPSDADLIFPGRFGGPMNPGSVSHIVRRLLKRAGCYRHWRGAHAFRRTFATEYLRANPKDMAGLKELLGHERMTSTELYVFLEPSDLRPRLTRTRL